MTEIEIEEMVARRPPAYPGMYLQLRGALSSAGGWAQVEYIGDRAAILRRFRLAERDRNGPHLYNVTWSGPEAANWRLPGEPMLHGGRICELPESLRVQEWEPGDLVLQRSAFFGTWHLERVILGHVENGNASRTAMRPPRGYVMTRPPARTIADILYPDKAKCHVAGCKLTGLHNVHELNARAFAELNRRMTDDLVMSSAEIGRARASQAIAARPASEQEAGLAAAGTAALGVNRPHSALAALDLRAPCKADRVRVRRFETPWDGQQ